MSTLVRIKENKVVAIIRGADPAWVEQIVQALHQGGVRVVEITLNSSNALALIKNLRVVFGDGMLIGAGTVMNAAEAEQAIDHGAQFIISPHLDIPTIGITRKLGAVSIPGGFTPSEIVHAYQQGGEIIKVFPAILGPSYLADIRAPLPHIPLMPTGGVNLQNIRAFYQEGATAFGIGNALVNAREKVTPHWLEHLQQKARDFVLAVDGDRSSST